MTDKDIPPIQPTNSSSGRSIYWRQDYLEVKAQSTDGTEKPDDAIESLSLMSIVDPLSTKTELMTLRDQGLVKSTTTERDEGKTDGQTRSANQSKVDKDKSSPRADEQPKQSTDKKDEKGSPLTGKKLGPLSTRPLNKPGLLPAPQDRNSIIRDTTDIQEKLGGNRVKEPYLKGKVTDNVWDSLRVFKVDRSVFDEVRTEINRHGVEPIDVWKNALKNSRVLGVGERHEQGSPHRLFVLAHMKELKESGATHLAIELHSTEQKDMIKAINEGKVRNDNELATFFKANPELFALLKAAKEAGLDVVAIDQNERTTSTNLLKDDSYKLTRDQFMALKVENILKANEQNKVVYFGGALHVVNSERSGDKNDVRMFDILRKKYAVTTVFDQIEAHHQAVAFLAFDVGRPVAVPTAKATKLANLSANPPGSDWNTKYSNWDYIFIYPQK